ncbi:homoserine kinase [Desertifilum sp. FACHB-1129]|uniref:Homoserine kinase n=1 Tax=Desertifilum tharense IPPAS B-1220 TaxID=1781255 RepID=A0A1E5QEF6_9CYAN|nr:MULTISPECIES: homoserine kinase [Desertifilum]MDA0209331.1 homoserine kinase [Cyanobacteria bacterium FC1]MBD2315015.1 homoserine kinase [Desertifilum sp. FACHB-1129]MBD2322870.1 homoserine kinase [Desertifilum sp. FACHB-866]MBD2332736.1 homoserine kinase [Desertifilum sp. FACHB-868]OEJ73050.1 homoserine kinase [Desertifilum tharense IPPAS B-1220]
MSQSVTLQVPATTANLGPGFDCIGAALTLYNTCQFSRLDAGELEITVSGVDAERVSTDQSNLLYQAFAKFYEQLGQVPPPVRIQIELGVPLARGLGSSATAIVGGLVGANWLAGQPLSTTEVMEIAIAIEGHPDNVVPALLGGCRLAASRGSAWEICEVPWHSEIVPVVAIPNFELSTAEARRVLPAQYSRADAIFNTAHFGLLVRALETGNPQWLQAALQDRIHQPYRQTLISGFDAVREAALQAGAYELVISGAGPTLLALTSPQQSASVCQAMSQAWQQQGISTQAIALAIDADGTKTID